MRIEDHLFPHWCLFVLALFVSRASLIAQLVKNPPVIQETWVDPGLGRSLEEGKCYPFLYSCLENSMDCIVHGASLVAQRLKRLPGMQDTWVQSLGWEDPLKKGTATHTSIVTHIVHGVAKSQTWLSHTKCCKDKEFSGVLVKYIVGCPAIGIVLMIFSWLDWSCGLEEGIWQEVKCHFHHIIWRRHAINMIYDCWHWCWSF